LLFAPDQFFVAGAFILEISDRVHKFLFLVAELFHAQQDLNAPFDAGQAALYVMRGLPDKISRRREPMRVPQRLSLPPPLKVFYDDGRAGAEITEREHERYVPGKQAEDLRGGHAEAREGNGGQRSKMRPKALRNSNPAFTTSLQPA